MDAAIYVRGAMNMLATGVEKCHCPKRYDGLSCQDPGKGFYRWRNTTNINTESIEYLIGRAVPCLCNGRSEDCDRETGVCQVFICCFTWLVNSVILHNRTVATIREVVIANSVLKVIMAIRM